MGGMDSTQKIEEQPTDGLAETSLTPHAAPVEDPGVAIGALAELDPAEAPDAADAIADRLGDSLVSPMPTDGDGDAAT